MRFFTRASKIEGGAFVVGLVVLFIVLALGTFAYLQNTGALKEYKINLFSVIGPDITEETGFVPDEEVSIGVTEGEVEPIVSDAEIKIPVIAGETKEGLSEPDEILTGEYVFEARSGEGVTHLARRAVSQYLAARVDAVEMTPEHRVYAEDYIQKQIGEKPLDLGEKLNISENLVREAVEHSQGLTETQLENLKQFSQLVAW
jgi:hypothetical protein